MLSLYTADLYSEFVGGGKVGGYRPPQSGNLHKVYPGNNNMAAAYLAPEWR